jgi:aminoglycoside phosphotransferase (APT) family kinase protein
LKRRLLPWLRERTGAPGLELREEPVERTDGFETQVFFLDFEAAPPELSGPLVLRLYRAHDEPERARVEATLQGCFADLDYPAPRPRLVVEADEPLGAPFQLMERLPGRGLGLLPFELDLNAEWLARIHALPCAPVQTALLGIGERPEEYGFAARLEMLGVDIERAGLAGLRPGHAWLVANRPVPRQEVPCHGDMMMNNLLREGRRVTGVVDWSAHRFVLADRELDVASVVATWLGFRASAPRPLAAGLGVVLRWAAGRLIRAYERRDPLDEARLLYYGLWRCLQILASAGAAAAGRPGRMRLDNPDNVLTARSVLEGYAAFFERETGVRISA